MPVDFTLPPDTRAVGQGNPPQDVDNIVDALTAMGAGMNVLNAAFAGGADPTGTNDSTAAIQAALNAGGAVYMPPGIYKTTASLSLKAGSSLAGAGWQQTVIQPTSALGAAPAISVTAGAGGSQANFYSKMLDFEIDLSLTASSAGIYYDHVAAVLESQVVVRFGTCARVIGWANDLTFVGPRSYNQTDSFWKWLHSYSADAPWDSANSGSTVGGGGSTYGDPDDFKIYWPLNYITSGAAAGTVNAFFTMKAGNDFQILGGHSLRTPGGAAYVTNGINVDFSWGSQKNLYLLYDMHEIDAVWDGTGGGSPHLGSGAAVALKNAHFARFGPNSWIGAYSASDNAEQWSLKLTGCSDVVVSPGGHWSGRGVLADSTNTDIVIKGEFPQPFSDPVISSAAAGTLDSSMNGLTLPQSSIAVDSMTGTLPASGSIIVATSGTGNGPQQVSYTGQSTTTGVTTFTGCTGGTGTLATGGIVVLRSLSSSVIDANYDGTLCDNVETLAGLIAGASTPQRTPLQLVGNATAPALLIGRAEDTKAWQLLMDTSTTGTLLFKNAEASTKLQLSDGGNLTINNNAIIQGGMVTSKISTQTANYTLASGDLVVLGNATGGVFTFTLPTAVGITGQRYTLKKIDSSANAITVATTSSQTIDGATTQSLASQWAKITVMSDGANWQMISSSSQNFVDLTSNQSAAGAKTFTGRLIVSPSGTPSVSPVDIEGSTNGAGQLVFAKNSPAVDGDHTLTVNCNDTSGTFTNTVAGNFTSVSGLSSTVYISGQATQRGVLKISHNPGSASGLDSSASLIALDTGSTAGTACQGIALISTTPTTGNLLLLRNNTLDNFVVKGNGTVAIGVAIGHTPTGMLEIQQQDTSTVGLAMTAIASGTDMINLKDSGGSQRFQVGNSGNATFRATAFFANPVMFGSTSTDVGGGGGGTIALCHNTDPTTNPASGHILLYCDSSGNLLARTQAGNVRTVAAV